MLKLKPMDLVPGDMLDLEADPYADPQHDVNDVTAYEYAVVESVERETSACAVVTTNLTRFGVHVDHELRVESRGSEPYAVVVDQIDFDHHLKAGTVLPHVYVCSDADEASEWITGRPGALDGRYGIDYPCTLEDPLTEDQLVMIHAPGRELVAIGGPEIIAARLAAGQEVVCGEGDDECAVRIVAGVVISYGEAVLAR